MGGCLCTFCPHTTLKCLNQLTHCSCSWRNVKKISLPLAAIARRTMWSPEFVKSAVTKNARPDAKVQRLMRQPCVVACNLGRTLLFIGLENGIKLLRRFLVYRR